MQLLQMRRQGAYRTPSGFERHVALFAAAAGKPWQSQVRELSPDTTRVVRVQTVPSPSGRWGDTMLSLSTTTGDLLRGPSAMWRGPWPAPSPPLELAPPHGVSILRVARGYAGLWLAGATPGGELQFIRPGRPDIFFNVLGFRDCRVSGRRMAGGRKGLNGCAGVAACCEAPQNAE
jgi:hypothetical protein